MDLVWTDYIILGFDAYVKHYTFLALCDILDHVIWIKAHGVMGKTALRLIGTVSSLWAYIILLSSTSYDPHLL